MKGRFALPILLLVFAVLAASIVVAGCLLYHNELDSCKTRAERKLTAIADLKVRNIVDWRKERLSDAQMVMHDGFFGQHVQEFLSNGAHTKVPSPLLARLQSIREHNQGLRSCCWTHK